MNKVLSVLLVSVILIGCSEDRVLYNDLTEKETKWKDDEEIYSRYWDENGNEIDKEIYYVSWGINGNRVDILKY